MRHSAEIFVLFPHPMRLVRLSYVSGFDDVERDGTTSHGEHGENDPVKMVVSAFGGGVK